MFQFIFCENLQTGPRKYKRRRKLKPHELERLRSEKQAKDSETDDEEELNGFDNLTTVATPSDNNGNEFDEIFQSETKIEKPSPSKLYAGKPMHRDGENITISEDNTSYTVFQNLENALQTYDSLVVGSGDSQAANVSCTATAVKPTNRTSGGGSISGNSAANKKRVAATVQQQSSRPKMIHTEKTRVPVIDGKRKSRTLITRTTSKSSQATVATPSPRKRATPSSRKTRTDLYDKDLDESNLLLELSKKKFKFDPDVVNDLEEILRSPIKSKENSQSEDYAIDTKYRKSQRSTRRTTAAATAAAAAAVADDVSHKFDINRDYLIEPIKRTRRNYRKSMVDVPVEELILSTEPDPTIVKEEIPDEIEVYTCEMCSAVFRERSQLLVHVPIHI